MAVVVVVVFFTFIKEMLCCDWKEHRQKSLQVELVTKYNTKDAQKESLVKGSKSAKGGPNQRRGVQISGGSKSAVTPEVSWW